MNFLNVFNCKIFFVDLDLVFLDVFCIDVCVIGGGGFFLGDWFYINWVVDYFNIVLVYIIYSFIGIISLEK